MNNTFQYLEFLSRKDADEIVNPRPGETKLGEQLEFLELVNDFTHLQDQLAASSSRYVVIGVPEGIGPRANFGRHGADSAWKPFLSKLLNMQSNKFLKGDELLVLGKVDCQDLMEEAEDIDFSTEDGVEQSRELVSEIDERLSPLIFNIVSSGKIPIVIGGGHNNSFPCLKGTALALEEEEDIDGLNCLNCDPHADFRELEGRHSGNGFSYAREKGYLNKYSIFGLHESYNAQSMLETMEAEGVSYESFEDIFVRSKLTFKEALYRCIENVKDEKVGIEIDMDSVKNFPVSAETPSGISAEQARQYVYTTGKELNTAYLHICESAPSLARGSAGKVGKLLAYLVTDFIKADISKG